MRLTLKKYQTSPIRKVESINELYANFDKINGKHPWQEAVPDAYVLYRARILKKSKIIYFNYSLAKEMGLIPENHPEKISHKLAEKIIDTFALRIINEYDIANKIEYPREEIKPNFYMATRYLQLQHNSRTGLTSGDGRSIWNGFISHSGQTWDISSCGTGATILSPGAAESGKLIKTGDKKICYGNGLADIDEGLSAAIQSEIFYRAGVSTERTLVILETPEKSAINVRAAANLIRPSHLFSLLKQSKLKPLQAALDLFLDRQIKNGHLPSLPRGSLKYDTALKILARDYAKFTAKLESEYIFCWLAWDGDNMLMNGGIIDYGSIRQFGILHHRYRYDDVDRFSTNILEQKGEAQRIVQTLAQLTEYVKTGNKNKSSEFIDHAALKIFQEQFLVETDLALLRLMGFTSHQSNFIMQNAKDSFNKFKSHFAYFEKATVPQEPSSVPDGINQAAIFDANGLLSELPRALLQNNNLIGFDSAYKWMETEFSRKINRDDARWEQRFLALKEAYLELINAVKQSKSTRKVLLELTMRSSLRKKRRITGDAVIFMVDILMAAKKRLEQCDFNQLCKAVIHNYSGEPFQERILSKKAQKYLQRIFRITHQNRHSI